MAAVIDVDVDPESYLPLFGLESFRQGQRDVISAVLAGQDCLCIMPTGGGKSLCYQLPAVARDGLTLVISPLIALMKDQVDSLVALGLRATFVNSTLPPIEQQARLDKMARGQYDLVYVVPERFRSPRFLEAVRAARLQLLAVDEAHCVSEWGHDFRPDYARIGKFRRQIGSPPTIALTATATQTVRSDIVDLLELHDVQCFVTGFERPNLRYDVQMCASYDQKDRALESLLRENPGSGIVYASTRKRCEEVAQKIAARTRRLTSVYHAGLAPAERRETQEAFMRGDVEIIVATNAFGMGVDKADVRLVAHYNMPGTLEAYYQEAGRAGRDGVPARCVLLYGRSDRFVQEFFIESAYPSRDVVAQVYEFLRTHTDEPIEMTQEDIKDELKLEIGAEGIGRCEQLLEKAGVLQRLDPCQNMAVVYLNSDLPTLVDLLPQRAKVCRKVLQAIERLVGPRRHEMVYFNRRELLDMAEVDAATLARALAQLRLLEAFDYVPPFRGRAVHMLQRDVPFEKLEIDFDLLERRKAAEYEKLERMTHYAETDACREQEILHYFGEPPLTQCGRCDNCTRRGGPRLEVHKVMIGDDPVYDAVRKVLSGVARANTNATDRDLDGYGRLLIGQMLCGSKAEKLKKLRLDRLSTYGILSQLTQDEVVAMIDGLTAVGCLKQVQIEPGRPIVQLTERGETVMRGQAVLEAGLALPGYLFDKLRQKPGATPQHDDIDGPVTDEADEARISVTDEVGPDDELLTVLKEWRRDEARRRSIAPHYVLSNKTLEELARRRPSSPEALLSVHGIGNAKLEQYGEVLLELTAGRARPPATAPDSVEPCKSPTEERSASDAPVRSQESAAPAGPKPSHYWTWRLLSETFTPQECAEIRGLTPDEVLDHALRAAEDGLSVSAEWLLDETQTAALDELIGDEPPEAIRPLLARLPKGTRYEHVQLYLKCRR